MTWKQRGKGLFFLYVVTLKLNTISPCLGLAGIKFAAPSDLQAYLQKGAHVDERGYIYSIRDDKSGSGDRIGRLILGRGAKSKDESVSADNTRKTGLTSSKHEEGAGEKREWASSVPDTTSRQSYLHLTHNKKPMSSNFSHAENRSGSKTISSVVSTEGTSQKSENHNMKDSLFQSSHSHRLHCTVGEIESKPLRGKHNIDRGDLEPVGSVKLDAGYQSDSASGGLEGLSLAQGKVGSRGSEGWLRARPMVHCGGKSMSLTVRGRGAIHLLIEQENAPPLSLYDLSPECGYSVNTTWRDLILTVPYDGCHVRREGGNYVLPLLWRGIPLKMSCPVPSAPTFSPPTVCCTPSEMVLTIEGNGSAEKLEVQCKLRWFNSGLQSLLRASSLVQ